MSTLFATKCIDQHEHVRIWTSDGPPLWLPEHRNYVPGNLCKYMAFIENDAFKLLFGCSEVPTNEECWEFESERHWCATKSNPTREDDFVGWRRAKIHLPPAPVPERTYTLEEIEKAMNSVPTVYSIHPADVKQALEALPKEKP